MSWRDATSYIKKKVTGLLGGLLSPPPCTTFPCNVQIPINGRNYSISVITSTWEHICKCNPQLNPRNSDRDYDILCTKVENYLTYSFLFSKWKAHCVANVSAPLLATDRNTPCTYILANKFVINSITKVYFRRWALGLKWAMQRELLAEKFIKQKQIQTVRKIFTAFQELYWDIEIVQKSDTLQTSPSEHTFVDFLESDEEVP